MLHATVKQRQLDKKRVSIGTENNNPILDSWSNKIEFLDGSTEAIMPMLLLRINQHKSMLRDIVSYPLMKLSAIAQNYVQISN